MAIVLPVLPTRTMNDNDGADDDEADDDDDADDDDYDETAMFLSYAMRYDIDRCNYERWTIGVR